MDRLPLTDMKHPYPCGPAKIIAKPSVKGGDPVSRFSVLIYAGAKLITGFVLGAL